MPQHGLSPDDRQFRRDFEKGRLGPDEFNHRGHVRLAYVYLVEHDDSAALRCVRRALLDFLDHHGIEPSKYHETRAWLLAVRHFMDNSVDASDSEEFIEANRALLDPQIMLTHYSADLLFSEKARAEFVEPDLQRIPRRTE